jgi:hypothetical protein
VQFKNHYFTATTPLSGKERKRQEAVLELIITEQDYIEDMETVHRVSKYVSW